MTRIANGFEWLGRAIPAPIAWAAAGGWAGFAVATLIGRFT